MYLKCHRRFKDGKEHRYFSIAEKRRVARGTVERHILYLGEINDSQRAAWIKQIEALDERATNTQAGAVSRRCEGAIACRGVRCAGATR